MAGDGVSYFAAQGSDSAQPDQTCQCVTHQIIGHFPASGRLPLLIQSQFCPAERIGSVWWVGWSVGLLVRAQWFFNTAASEEGVEGVTTPAAGLQLDRDFTVEI